MSGKRSKSSSSVMTFHRHTLQTMSSGTGSLAFTPGALGQRFQAEADAWTLFRLLSAKFRIFGDSTLAVATPAACGVVEGVPDTLPTTVATITDLLPSVTHMGANQSRWSQWVTIPKSMLAGQIPWYQTSAGTFPSVAEVPCTFVFVGGSTSAVIALEILWTAQFKSQVPTTSTPMQLALAERIRAERLLHKQMTEKRKMMELLSSSTSAARSEGAAEKKPP